MEPKKGVIKEFEELSGALILQESREKDQGAKTRFIVKPFFKGQQFDFLIKFIFKTFQEELWSHQSQIASEHVIKLKDLQVEQELVLLVSHQPFIRTLQDPLLTESYKKKMMILNSVARGLQDLSKQSICHNAIEPRSIVICRESKIDVTAKLHNFYYSSKFEKSKSKAKKDFRHKRITPYSSPEIRFQTEVDLKSDVWSLGALFYYLVFGKSTQISVTSQSVTYSVPTGTPQWMRTALSGLLASKPSARYDISRACYFFRSALLCAQTAEKCLNDANPKKLQKITV